MSITGGNKDSKRIYCNTPNGVVEVTDVYAGTAQGAIKIWSNSLKLARIKFENNDEVNAFFEGLFYPFYYKNEWYRYITIDGTRFFDYNKEGEELFIYSRNQECIFTAGCEAVVDKGDVLEIKVSRTGSTAILTNSADKELYGDDCYCVIRADGLPGDDNCGYLGVYLKEGEEARVYNAETGALVGQCNEAVYFKLPLPTGLYLLKGNLRPALYDARFYLNSISLEARAVVKEVEYKYF